MHSVGEPHPDYAPAPKLLTDFENIIGQKDRTRRVDGISTGLKDQLIHVIARLYIEGRAIMQLMQHKPEEASKCRWEVGGQTGYRHSTTGADTN